MKACLLTPDARPHAYNGRRREGGVGKEWASTCLVVHSSSGTSGRKALAKTSPCRAKAEWHPAQKKLPGDRCMIFLLFHLSISISFSFLFVCLFLEMLRVPGLKWRFFDLAVAVRDACFLLLFFTCVFLPHPKSRDSFRIPFRADMT